MTPFTYPAAPHVRQHGPQGYAEPKSYRPWLRDEFHFRCVYCLLRERWGRVAGMFDLDHFLPTARHPEQSRTYDNLLYACATCNAAKGDQATPDPCEVLVNGDAAVRADGTLELRTPDARRLVRMLGLDSRLATEFRQLWIGIVALAKRFDRPLHRRLMGFPDDLPNLARRPPGGNTRPEGVAGSAFARRQNGTLPESY
jgi:HNH endonuclease